MEKDCTDYGITLFYPAIFSDAERVLKADFIGGQPSLIVQMLSHLTELNIPALNNP